MAQPPNRHDYTRNLEDVPARRPTTLAEALAQPMNRRPTTLREAMDQQMNATARRPTTLREALAQQAYDEDSSEEDEEEEEEADDGDGDDYDNREYHEGIAFEIHNALVSTLIILSLFLYQR